MAWAVTYTIADGNATPVNQVYNRTVIRDNYVKYVNDTARGNGIDEFFEMKRASTKKGVGASQVGLQRWNVKWSSRIIASETEPMTLSFTMQLTDSLSAAVAATRIRLKSARNVVNSLTDTDAKLDDVTASRVL